MAENRSDSLRHEIRRDILSGRLAPGARLPTERALAAQYAVSLTTINKVMAGLELEGLLERGRGRGTFVRPDLAQRAVAVVFGPPHAPPGPRFWADVGRRALQSAAQTPGGVRAYLAAGTAPSGETALARDARAGRLAGALLLGAGVGAAAVLEEAGVPTADLAGDGDESAVRIAWGEAVGDLVAEMIRRRAAPVAIQLAPGPPGREMLDAYRRAVEAAGGVPDERLIGSAGAADGPAGWRWIETMLADCGARGLVLAGAEPEGALAALAQVRDAVPAAVAVAVVALAGRVPAFAQDLARLEVDAAEVVQAGMEMLSAGRRAEARAGVTIRPRFVPGATFPSA